MHIVLFVLFLSLSNVLAADSASVSPTKTIPLMKPHDHTGKALDIMVKKDVVREDYGRHLYRKHCATCHGIDRHSGQAPELSEETLRHHATISDLYPIIKRGCPKSGAPRFETLGNVKLIFLARYIKKPL
jgi:mono/diheme cytochrome c family protein